MGVTEAHDAGKAKDMVKQIQAVIPDKKLEMVLKGYYFDFRVS